MDHAASIPHIRISQLEPCQQVAAGIVALYLARLHALPVHESDSSIKRDTILVQVIAECLETWQQESLDGKMKAWLTENPSYEAGFFVTDSGEQSHCVFTKCEAGYFVTAVPTVGSAGASPSEAFGEALKAWDQR